MSEVNTPKEEEILDGGKDMSPEEKAKQEEAKAEEQRSLVNEVKALRAEKRAALEAKEAAEKLLAEKANQEKDETTLKVEAILAEKEKEQAVKNKELAMSNFIAQRKEFHEDNDPTGVKMQALKNKFAMFNTSGMSEVEQFSSVIMDAYKLLGGKEEHKEDTKFTPQSGFGEGSYSSPKTTSPAGELSLREKKLVDSGRHTKEQILRLREKNPQLLEDLLEFVRV